MKRLTIMAPLAVLTVALLAASPEPNSPQQPSKLIDWDSSAEHWKVRNHPTTNLWSSSAGIRGGGLLLPKGVEVIECSAKVELPAEGFKVILRNKGTGEAPAVSVRVFKPKAKYLCLEKCLLFTYSVVNEGRPVPGQPGWMAYELGPAMVIASDQLCTHDDGWAQVVITHDVPVQVDSIVRK